MLYIVGLPIGNLEDISLRALRHLKECDLILAEDTRRTGKLLKHYEISTPQKSYHEHTRATRTLEYAQLALTQDLCLVSDGGTPTISDPGYSLLQACLQAGVEISPIPGPCAAISALSAAGVPTDAFYFIGFLTKRKNKRRTTLEKLLSLHTTLVLYESPYRIKALLEDINTIIPEHDIVVARELTKRFETMYRGSASEIISLVKEKGEFTVIIPKVVDIATKRVDEKN